MRTIPQLSSLTCLVALLALTVSTVACGGPSLPFEPAGPESAPDPAATGPYAVGV